MRCEACGEVVEVDTVRGEDSFDAEWPEGEVCRHTFWYSLTAAALTPESGE